MKYLLFILLLTSNLNASSLFEVKEASILFKHFKTGSRNPLIDYTGIKDREIDRELSLFLNINIWDRFYFNNQILSFTDRNELTSKVNRFRLVGWNFKIGYRVFDWLDFEYEHFSKHLLDAKYPAWKYPVEDSLGIKIYFIK